MIITLDGPSGSGKWTIAHLLAEKLGFKYLDSGSMYRAVGLYLFEKGVDIEHVQESDIADIHVGFSPDHRVEINGEDYESKIRNVWVSIYASKISAQKCTRELVISAGERIISQWNYVLEWRDTGTVWAPNADVKFYLDADIAVRAHRRWKDLIAQGQSVTEEEVLAKIQERDNRDMTRSDGPLRKPDGAYEIDTTYHPAEHQIEYMYGIIQEVLQKKTNLA